jgi:hypothetical protein
MISLLPRTRFRPSSIDGGLPRGASNGTVGTVTNGTPASMQHVTALRQNGLGLIAMK